MRRAWAGLLAASALVAGLVVPAASAGPMPIGQVPCPSVALTSAGRSILATVAPDTTVPPSLSADYGATRYPGVPAIGLVPFAVPAGQVDAFSAALRAVPGVRAVEPDHVAHATALRLRQPHDPLLPRQWSLAKIHASQAWGVEIGTTRVLPIAVLDTGVDSTHPDLKGRVVNGFDFYDGDADPSDEQSHGTAVASVIAADTDNRIGIAGLSWGAQILSVRVLGPDGAGTECTIAAGMVYAATEAYAENLSLAANAPCSFVMQQAVDFALNNSTPVIAAVGNDALKKNPSMEPANCDGVVGVAATDANDRVAKFSEHGPQVMLSAPGVHILAAYRTPQGGHAYAYFDGTSLAAPMVTGVAALLMSKHSNWSTQQVIDRLKATSTDLGKKGRDDYYGVGRVDAGRALTAR